MKFLCLCHYETAAFARLGTADFEEIGRLCAPHDAALKASGHVDMVGSLGTPGSFRTLRVREGAVMDEAGPYAETPEPFGAYFIVEAESIDEAVRIARLHPSTNLGNRFGNGGIEIRPIEQIETL